MINSKRRRRKTGSAIAEFGPALFIILIVFLFPMIDLIYLGAAYSAGWYCNHLVIREVAIHDPTDQGAMQSAIQTATQAWSSSGLCSFIGGATLANVQNKVRFQVIDNASDNVLQTYDFPPAAPAPTSTPGLGTSVGYCIVNTSITIKPFVTLPWLGECPGINAPITFNFGDMRPQEEKGVH